MIAQVCIIDTNIMAAGLINADFGSPPVRILNAMLSGFNVGAQLSSHNKKPRQWRGLQISLWRYIYTAFLAESFKWPL